MFAMMVRERDLTARLDFDSVRDISIGSAPLTDALLEQVQRLFPRADVHNGFGTTEAGPAVFGPHPQGVPTPPLSLGYPRATIDWQLVDGPTPDEGVLALRTPALMHGYLNLPQVTAQKMRDGLYLTGDVMRRDAAGFFYFVGRADDMFVCGGENIYPGEVEKLLERHAAVAQAVVVSAPDDIKGQIPVAFVVPRADMHPSVEEIKQYALANGPAYAHPRFVVFRDHLPLSGTHKIDRAALAAEAAQLSRAAGRASATRSRAHERLSGSRHLGLRRPRAGLPAVHGADRGRRRALAACTRAASLKTRSSVSAAAATWRFSGRCTDPRPDDDDWTRACARREGAASAHVLHAQSATARELAQAGAARGWKNAVGRRQRTRAARWREASNGSGWRRSSSRLGRAFPFFIDWLDSPHPGRIRGAAAAARC